MIHTTRRSILAAVALCIMVACERPAATGPETGSTTTPDISRQTLRGIVRHATDEWTLELPAGTTVQLTGTFDLAPFEGRDAVVMGIVHDGIMVVESCTPPRSIDAEYSRR